MESTDLMINEPVNAVTYSGKESPFALAIAVIVGLLGILAAGGSISGNVPELLPALSAAAVPGLVAWVIAYLTAGGAIERTDDEEIIYE